MRMSPLEGKKGQGVKNLLGHFDETPMPTTALLSIKSALVRGVGGSLKCPLQGLFSISS
jgi:hypothetical protein